MKTAVELVIKEIDQQQQDKKLYSEEWWSNLSDKFYESNLAHDYKDGKIDYRHIRNWFLEKFKQL